MVPVTLLGSSCITVLYGEGTTGMPMGLSICTEKVGDALCSNLRFGITTISTNYKYTGNFQLKMLILSSEYTLLILDMFLTISIYSFFFSSLSVVKYPLGSRSRLLLNLKLASLVSTMSTFQEEEAAQERESRNIGKIRISL